MSALVRIVVHALAVIGLITVVSNCQRAVDKISEPRAEDESLVTIDGWDAGHLKT